MGFEILEIYKDLTNQVYRCWYSAVICHNSEAEQEINRLLKECVNKAVTFSKKQHMYRARIIEMNQYRKIHLEEADDLFSGRSGIYGFPACEMGAPPLQKSNAGRANRQGTSYLYLASSKETACAEVQSTCGDLVSVATFELDNNLQLADFRDVPDCLNSFLDKDDPQKLVDIVFFQSIIDLFFRPVRRGTEDIYQYSQYIADSLKGLGIHGILYNSSHSDATYNVVLFNPSNAQCVSEYGEVFRCLSVVSKYQCVSWNYSSNNLEVLEVKREEHPYLWNSNAILRRDISEIQKQELGE